MAIEDIISEEVETSTPNMEVARGGPEDFMTDDEMDPYQDPEFQQLLESLPTEQAEVLMQLIKEFKAMVAQGFTGEFEDFVKMKMSTAQGGPEDFPTEDEMQIGSEELQSLIPMGQQVAQGGRIGYGLGSWVKRKLGLGRKEARAQASADRPAGNISDEELRNKAFNYFKNKYSGDSWKNNFREQWTSPFIQAAQGGRIGYGGGTDLRNKMSKLLIKLANGTITPEEMIELRNIESASGFSRANEAQGGRIGYQNAGPVGGGIMDVVAEEQIETGPTPQELIMQWLEARGLPITPENIQRAIIEMSREGQAPAMTREQSLMPQMEMPGPPTGKGYVPEEWIGQDITETVTPDVATIIPRAKPDVEEAVYSDQEMRDMKQDYLDKGGTLDEDKWFGPKKEKAGIMQTTDPIFYSDDKIIYTDDDKKEWFDKMNRLPEVSGGLSPDSYLRLKDDRMKEGVNKGFISEEDYLKWQMPFFGQGGENITKRIDNYRNWAFGDDNYAQGGRAGYNYGGRARYGLGSLVKSIFKGAKKGVKNLVKSVKKFAKSDLGKAALMYIATAGMGNILQPGAASWASPFTKGAGTGWLRPGTVLSNYGNLFKGSPEIASKADALTSGSIASGPVTADAAFANTGKSLLSPASEKLLAAKNAGSGSGMFSGLLGSFKSNPVPWILGSSLGAGLYTKMNPGDDNLDELMRNYAGEEAAWDQRIADIRAGKIKTPFSTANITYPYPDYSQYAAEGGRIGRAEGGLMNLGGLEKDYRAEGGFVPIGGKEKADDVPARLSRNEFVFTADAVRNAGGGDVDRGSEVMQNIMTNLEQGGSISEESQGLEGARDMFEVSERLSEVV